MSLGRGAKNFLAPLPLAHSMPRDSNVVPVLEVAAIIEALRGHLRGVHSHALHCPRAAPSAGVVHLPSLVWTFWQA